MCEILVTRANDLGHQFEKSAYEAARSSNYDGAGYAIFNRIAPGQWELADTAIYPEKFPGWKNSRYYKHGYYDKNNIWHEYNKPKAEKKEKKAFTEPPTKSEVEAEIDRELDEHFAAIESDEYFGFDDAQQNLFDSMRVGGYKPTIPLIPENTPTRTADICHSIRVRGFEPKGEKNSFGYTPDQVPDKIFAIQEELEPGQLMIAHFRFATTGENTESNTHPLIHGDYLVIHNGVFAYKYIAPGKSDTRTFIEIIDRKAKRVNVTDPEREQQIIETALERAGGYYSIFIYSFRTKQLYYYKDERASFFWDVSGLLGATRSVRFPVTNLKAQSHVIQ